MRSLLLFVMVSLVGCAQLSGSPENLEQITQSVEQCTNEPKLPRLFERRNPDANILHVTLDIDLLPPHEVGAVHVRRSSGYPDLDDAAVQAIKAWACPTAAPLEKPVRLEHSYTFHLNGNTSGLEKEAQTWKPANVYLRWQGTYTATPSARVVIGSNDISKRTTTIEGFTPIAETSHVKAALGTNFGISYTFDAPPPRIFTNYRIVWKFPDGGYVHGYSGKRVYSNIRDRTCKIGVECIAGWTFDNPWEQVEGIWTVELWLNDKMEISRSFEVVLP